MNQFYALFEFGARVSIAGMAVLRLFLAGRGVFATARATFFLVILSQTFATFTVSRQRPLSRSGFAHAP